MTNDKGIFIKNIYYMLTYAFQVLKQTTYEEIAGESFEEIHDLFAAIMAKGIAQQLKQGLYREYVSKQEALSVMRGKLNISDTIRQDIRRKRLISCEYDELSENNIYNRILKTTALELIRQPSVSNEQRRALKKSMVYFGGVDTIEPRTIRWDALRIQRNNRTYEMLMNICYFVLDGLLQTTEQGKYRMAVFSDDHMNLLYERFVYEYYRHHRQDLQPIHSKEVKWNKDADKQQIGEAFLPTMKTDIMLRKDDKILIIDTKYYGSVTRRYYDRETFHSANLYQIFAYVKNLDRENTGRVSGALLYARPGEGPSPHGSYYIAGSNIRALTLDLSMEFEGIKRQLDELADSVFGK